jgi:hypothetical protein
MEQAEAAKMVPATKRDGLDGGRLAQGRSVNCRAIATLDSLQVR